MSLTPRVAALTYGLLLASTASADAVMVTRAMKASTIMEAFVEEDALVVKLELGDRDLAALPRLDEALSHAASLPAPIPTDAEFSFLADGRRLRGSIEKVERRVRLERDEITGEPLPNATGEEVLFTVLRYPLQGRPKTLTLEPPSSNGRGLADVGFALYHDGIAINDFRYLATSELVKLDWDDPFYSRFERRTMNRKFDSPMNIFLYVEPFEVRKEFVVRPADLARFTSLDLDAGETIPADRREAVLLKVAEFLATEAPVTIDGEQPTPILDRIHFLERGLRMTRVVGPDEPVDLTSAIIGAIFVYPVAGMPKEVRLQWDLFDERITRVPATATDEAGPMPYVLTPDDSELHWVNYLKGSSIPGELEVRAPRAQMAVPIAMGIAALVALVVLVVAWARRSWPIAGVAVVLLAIGWLSPTRSFELTVPSGVRAPSGEEAAPTIHSLLYNVYRALDFREEEVIFDRLDQSLSGDVLERVYLEMRSGLRLENQGGARVRVRDVELLDVIPQEIDQPDTLRYKSRWNATGSVGHWGHTHMRTNQYEALITLARIDDRWKIADLAILEEERLTPNQPQRLQN